MWTNVVSHDNQIENDIADVALLQNWLCFTPKKSYQWKNEQVRRFAGWRMELLITIDPDGIQTLRFQVRDVRLITDNKTRRSKGIAYVEFSEVESVPLAMGLDGQRLLSVPIIVQASQAEKNRLGAAASILAKGNTGPMRLYVGSLHFNINDDMLRGIFEPFGKVGYRGVDR